MGMSLATIFTMICSVITYMTVVYVPENTSETSEWWGNGAKHIYIYWNWEWFQVAGVLALIGFTASFVCFFIETLIGKCCCEEGGFEVNQKSDE